MYNKIINNKIKSALLAVVALIVVFAPMYGALASTFNNDPQDNPTFRISNYTKNPGCSTCWTSSASANQGEIVSFDIYYHNTGSQTANNVTLRSTLPSGTFTSANIPVVITDSAGGQASGSVSLNLTSAQTLTFIPGSVKWYPNQTLIAQALPLGQNGSEVVGSGLNIGSIAPGWATQGHVVFRALVGSVSQPQASAPIVNTTTATNISTSSATLNATVNPNGSNTNVWFEYGASPGSLSNMSSSQSIGGGTSSLNVSAGVSGLSSNTTYYFRAVAQNSAGTSYGNVLSFTTSFSGGGGGGTNISSPTVSTNGATNILSDSAVLNAVVSPNNDLTAVWFEYGTSSGFFSLTTNSQNIGSGSFGVNTSVNIYGLSSNTTYYFRAVARNSAGTNYGNILSFTTGFYGGGGGGGGISAPIVTTNFASGISRDTATLNATVNPNGSFTNAWFEYGNSPSSMPLSSSIQSVGSGNFNYNISSSILNLLPNTTYYFRVVAQNSNSIAYGTTLSFTTTFASGTSSLGPNVSTLEATNVGLTSAILNAMVNPNNVSTDVWFEYNSSIDKVYRVTPVRSAGQSNYAIKVSAEVRDLLPNTLYDFRIVGKNLYGTNYGSQMSFFTSLGGVNVIRTGGLPSIFTKPAYSITSNSAILDASVNPNNSATNVWFEYGASAGLLGSKTTFRNAGMGNNYVDSPIIAQGLLPNATYYYRPVAQNSAGISYGVVNSFTTGGIKLSIPATTPVVKAFRPLLVRFEVDKSEVNVEGKLKYLIVIKNENDSSVKIVQLSLGMPENIEIVDYDIPLSNGDDSGILSANLGTLGGGEEIVKTVTGRVRTNAKVGDVLTAIASVNYQDTSGSSQPIISLSASSVVGDGFGLGASIFDALKTLSFSSWLILILIVTLAVISVLLIKAKRIINLK
ncbi:MAG: DUF11 domain-containing protein [Parcubacteria group bacterium]|nr:DUF11 domain-containing protein [Parcubacteria group bacterium]MCR4342920.1 DUF11 domain-containing protein [Patescibacteria group bacterium]